MAFSPVFFVVAEEEMTPNAIAFNRLLIAAIAFAAWNITNYYIQTKTVPPSEKPDQQGIGLPELVMLFGAGLCFVTFLVLVAWSYTQTTVANATLFIHMMPMFTTLGAWFLLGRRPNPQFILGMVVATAGAAVIGIGDWSVADSSWLGDLSALGAAILLAGEILLVEQLRTRFSTPIITMSECAIGSMLALPIVFFTGKAFSLPPGTVDWQF